MAKRPNYGFVKREKELKRMQRKAEKLERKRTAKDEAAPQTGSGPESVEPADD